MTLVLLESLRVYAANHTLQYNSNNRRRILRASSSIPASWHQSTLIALAYMPATQRIATLTAEDSCPRSTPRFWALRPRRKTWTPNVAGQFYSKEGALIWHHSDNCCNSVCWKSYDGLPVVHTVSSRLYHPRYPRIHRRWRCVSVFVRCCWWVWSPWVPLIRLWGGRLCWCTGQAGWCRILRRMLWANWLQTPPLGFQDV